MAREPQRILITGAAGFVGQHLVPMLRSSFPNAALFTEYFDITDAAAVAEIVRNAQPDACIHLAAVTTIAGAQEAPDLAWQVNVLGTLSLARAILAYAPACRFLFASSAETYGKSFQAGAPLDESALLAPMNSYAATKAAADLALGAMTNED